MVISIVQKQLHLLNFKRQYEELRTNISASAFFETFQFDIPLCHPYRIALLVLTI